MKNALIALSVLVLLAACGSKNNGNTQAPPYNNPNVYALDVPAECAGPTQNAMPLEYENAGCSPYRWDRRGHFGRNDGCPRDMFAACATGVGMICVPQTNYSVAWWQYNDGNRRAQFCGYEGYASGGSCSYRSVPGAGTIGRACLVGGVNECGYGHCQPIGNRLEKPRRGNRDGGRNRGSQPRAIGVCVQ